MSSLVVVDECAYVHADVNKCVVLKPPGTLIVARLNNKGTNYLACIIHDDLASRVNFAKQVIRSREKRGSPLAIRI